MRRSRLTRLEIFLRQLHFRFVNKFSLLNSGSGATMAALPCKRQPPMFEADHESAAQNNQAKLPCSNDSVSRVVPPRKKLKPSLERGIFLYSP